VQTIVQESDKRSDRMSFTMCVLEPSLSPHRDISDDLLAGRPIAFAASLKLQWDGVPGRGEYIRLIFEYTGTPYDEVKDNSTLTTRVSDPEIAGFPQNLWPPALELPNGKWISQTGVIVNYLSPKLGLAGHATDNADLDEDEKRFLHAKNAQLFFTVLDMTVEASRVYSRGLVYGLFIKSCLQAHGVHHPISTHLYYEDQKAEALRVAEQFRSSRLLKFLHHFQSVLETNPANKDGKGNVFDFNTMLEIVVDIETNKGPFLLSNLTTAADLALFHNMTGVEYAFPRRLKNIKESGPHFPPFMALSLTIKLNSQIRSRLQTPGAHSERSQDCGVSEEQQTSAVQHIRPLQALPRTRR